MLVPYRPELGGFALTPTETLQTGERLASTLLSFTGMGANRQDKSGSEASCSRSLRREHNQSLSHRGLDQTR
jgi:hypothetical protein